MKIQNIAWLLVLVLFASGCVSNTNTTANSNNAHLIQNGDNVSVDYTGYLDNGTIFDSSIGKKPLDFTVGAHQVIPGFENGVLGMKVGESKSVHVKKEDAYEYREDLVANFSTKAFGNSTIPPVGTKINTVYGPGKITAIYKDENITVDFNSDLAGLPLNFNVTIVKIN